MDRYLGIDIGGTKTSVVLGDGDCQILEKSQLSMKDFPGPGTVIEEIIRLAEGMRENCPVKAVGISCGGPLDSGRGVILSPPNLPGWDEVPIAARLAEQFGVPAFLQNDANACALAEWRFGSGRGTRSMVFLTFGTGMGAGLILDGRLYAGANDMAGEIGHVRLESFGPVGYGKAGSFEGFCSGGGIRQQILSVLEEHRQRGTLPSGVDAKTASAKTLAELAQAGEEWALDLYRQVGDNLGRGLAILIDLLNPEAIVIGSIYSRSGELMEEAMTKAVRREALAPSRRSCRILKAQLGDRLGDVAALSVAINGLELGQ